MPPINQNKEQQKVSKQFTTTHKREKRIQQLEGFYFAFADSCRYLLIL